jgi:serine/threonine-protein kinase HipA
MSLLEMSSQELLVRLGDEAIGWLRQSGDGRMQFDYLSEANKVLSIGMPLKKKRFDHKLCEAFFGGLLPESEAVRKVLASRFGIRASDNFALLKAIGNDCAGAVSLHDPSQVVTPSTTLARLKELSESELAEEIRQLPRRPLFVDAVEGLRLSLAGAQDKGAVCLINNRVALPLDGAPSTHILKPNIPELENTVLNEYLCLRIAAQIGLQVPKCELRQAEDQAYLLVERYDRQVQNGCIIRIHQEDFCQALGIVSARKYERQDGPSLARCFTLIEKTEQPAVNKLTFLNYITFNYLVGNMDAHGKNFALLHTPRGVQLAPIYDVLCTVAYAKLTSEMAMKVGGQYRADGVTLENWQAFAKENQLSFTYLRGVMKKMAEALLPALENEINQLPPSFITCEISENLTRAFEKKLNIVQGI